MKATKRILENIAWDLPWIFRYVFQYIQPKLFYAKGLGKGNKCALGIKSVGIKKAEPLSSAYNDLNGIKSSLFLVLRNGF